MKTGERRNRTANTDTDTDTDVAADKETETKSDSEREERPACPDCGDRLVKSADGAETYCDGCGAIVSEYRIDHGPEWRTFAADEKGRNVRRTGPPRVESLHDHGLGSMVNNYRYRATQTPARQRRMKRMIREHNRAQVGSKANRNLVYAFTEIRRVVAQLELPIHIREQACSLFRQAQAANLMTGRTLEGFAGACLYVACRMNGVTRRMEELTGTCRATYAQINNSYKALVREFDLPMSLIRPGQYLGRYATRLDLPDHIEREARELIAVAQEEGMLNSGVSPSSVTAACIYQAALDTEHKKTQFQVCAAANITTPTLRAQWYHLVEILDEGESGAEAGAEPENKVESDDDSDSESDPPK